MVTTEDLQGLVNQISYKPGWTFEMCASVPGSISLDITIEATCSRDATQTRIIPHGDTVSCEELDLDHPGWQERFLQWVFNQIMHVEYHEAQEVFRINGQIFDDPHLYMMPCTVCRQRATSNVGSAVAAWWANKRVGT